MRRVIGLMLALTAAGAAGLASSAQSMVAVTEDTYPPYNSIVDGQPQGGSVDFIRAILREAGLESVPVLSFPWARAYEMAQGAQPVIIFSMARTATREKLFKWGGIVGPYDVFMYALRTRGDIVVETLDDARNYLSGTTRNDARELYLLSKGFSLGQHIDSGTDNPTNLRKLMAKRIDLWPIAELVAIETTKSLGFEYSGLVKAFALPEISNGLWFACSLGTPDEVVARLQAAHAKLVKNGSYAAIWRKYGVSVN